ncbi:putative argonaute siRNA chaperone (ARC) complex subunit Arb1 [Elsinoe australis]|uniref:Putative argonaute siRNA chaperone (ARC) complex subunit Arb1 n=1 Tax=Elsinoe australis TaxID=40998 RepID=A0A4U7B3M8_9PEZI|nr:putative argonaute siRNA chaperone (ARC) complex subunit Arb1 [Elsinoe australis]
MASDTVNDHADLVENTTSEDANAQGEACGKNGGELTDVEREIIRQVEYYFSDENLPNDAHMLALTNGPENWPVNLGRITGFGRMRGYKPKSIVAEALKKSTFLEFTDKKHIRRRVPLAIKPNVEQDIVPGKNAPALAKARKVKQPQIAPDGSTLSNTGPGVLDPDQPWLTKGMLKETGFEEYYADPPVTPAQYEENQMLYSQDNVFTARIETAIQRYSSRRKFHQDTRYIFDAWMSYGGIESKPRQFTGRISQDELQTMDAGEIAAALATHHVSSQVEHTNKWKVDFPGVAKGFLSSETILLRTGGSADNVANFTNVMSNFYRWLLQHDVCPEYTDQIKEALQVCKIANYELTSTVRLSSWLPGAYNRSCSAVSGGSHATLLQSEDDGENKWWAGTESTGIKKSDAEMLIVSAIILLGSDEHRNIIAKDRPKEVVKTGERDLRLQVMAIELPDDALRTRFEEEKKLNKTLQPMGKMHCRQLNKNMTGFREGDETVYTFWIEEAILEYCFLGMKMQATVCENNIGCMWLDRIQSVNPSYFEIVANGYYEKSQDAVLPHEWYRRQRKIKEQGYTKMSDMQAGSEEGEAVQLGAEEEAVPIDDSEIPSCTFVDHRDTGGEDQVLDVADAVDKVKLDG